jgi:hypothetical protein
MDGIGTESRSVSEFDISGFEPTDLVLKYSPNHAVIRGNSDWLWIGQADIFISSCLGQLFSVPCTFPYQ